MKPDEVLDVFSKNDIFLFPTKGENFGHVIYEALSVGCIPIISDQTPWQNLEEKKCGFVCKLSEIESFRRAIMKSKKNADDFNQLKKNAVSYAEKNILNLLKNQDIESCLWMSCCDINYGKEKELLFIIY